MATYTVDMPTWTPAHKRHVFRLSQAASADLEHFDIRIQIKHMTNYAHPTCSLGSTYRAKNLTSPSPYFPSKNYIFPPEAHKYSPLIYTLFAFNFDSFNVSEFNVSSLFHFLPVFNFSPFSYPFIFLTSRDLG
jgi:hypothetical protein